MDDKSGKQAIEYGIVPIDVMALMSGLDFVRAIFARRLPEPPIMQTVEPFDCTAETGVVVIHSVPGLRHYNPIGSVHGGYAAILLDSGGQDPFLPLQTFICCDALWTSRSARLRSST